MGSDYTQFDYLLNALERASQEKYPAKAGYGGKRKALYAYVRDLEARAIPAEVIAFLKGEAPLDGVWFGDPHPAERGTFWWRKRLSAASQSSTSADGAADEAHNGGER